MPGGGLPFEAVRAAFAESAVDLPLPPSWELSRESALRALWTNGGLQAVETRAIEVRRSFADFETFWSVTMGVGTIGEMFAKLDDGKRESIKHQVRLNLRADHTGEISCTGKANAVRGVVPG